MKLFELLPRQHWGEWARAFMCNVCATNIIEEKNRLLREENERLLRSQPSTNLQS